MKSKKEATPLRKGNYNYASYPKFCLKLSLIFSKKNESVYDKPVHPKGNLPWILIGMTDAEAEAPDAKSQLTGEDPDAGKD